MDEWRGVVMRSIDTAVCRAEHEQDNFVAGALTKGLRLKWVNEALKWSGRHSVRGRLLPAEFVVWFVVLLGLCGRTSYRDLLTEPDGTWWSRWRWPRDKPPSTSAVMKVRDRLGSADKPTSTALRAHAGRRRTGRGVRTTREALPPSG